MKYRGKPVSLVSVESGHVVDGADGKEHVTVETESLSEIIPDNDMPDIDDTKNVVVLSIESLANGQNENLALNLDDCRLLCRDVLCHLATGGDEIAMHLIRHMPHGPSNCDGDCDNCEEC